MMLLPTVCNLCNGFFYCSMLLSQSLGFTHCGKNDSFVTFTQVLYQFYGFSFGFSVPILLYLINLVFVFDAAIILINFMDSHLDFMCQFCCI
jgi:hypothetical protein